MNLAESKYNIKYDNDQNGNFITEIQFAQPNGIDILNRSNLEKLDKSNFEIIAKSEEGVIYAIENIKNHDVLIEGHPLYANTIHCPNIGSEESRIFSRLLFWNLLNDEEKVKLPNNLL
jgi:hypothetical protein